MELNLQLQLVKDIMTAFHANEVPEMLAGCIDDEARCRLLVQAVCSKDPSIILGFIVLAPELSAILGGMHSHLFVYKYVASSKLVVLNGGVERLLFTDSSLNRYNLHRDINSEGGIQNVYNDIEHIRCHYFGNYNPIHSDAL